MCRRMKIGKTCFSGNGWSRRVRAAVETRIYTATSFLTDTFLKKEKRYDEK